MPAVTQTEMMAGVLKGPLDIRVEKIPVFSISPGQILIEIKACGICGSDIRYFHGENPWALHTLGVERPNPPNIVIGHEYAGKVVRVASDRDKPLLNKNVAVVCFRTCGRCDDCKRGNDQLCKTTQHIGHGAGWGTMDYYPGAMANFCIGWGDLAFPVPDDFPMEEAAMMDVIAVGVHAARQGGVRPGADVTILGAGPIGSAIQQAAFALGARRVFISDIYDRALEIANACGATRTIHSAKEPVVGIVREETGGRGADHVFDTVGTEKTFHDSLDLLAPAGTLVNMAVHGETLSFKGTAIGSERCVKTSCNFKVDDFKLGLEWLLQGKLTVKPWITHRVSLPDLPKSIRMLEEKEKHGAFKIVVRP